MSSVTMRRFIVLRKCPLGSESLEGCWFILDSAIKTLSFPLDNEGIITLGPTGRYETREDGERAEVYEPCEPEVSGGGGMLTNKEIRQRVKEIRDDLALPWPLEELVFAAKNNLDQLVSDLEEEAEAAKPPEDIS